MTEDRTVDQPHKGISFHPIPGGAILFDAVQGRLYALNPVAGLTWLCVKNGLSQPESIRNLAEAFDLDQTVAAAWLSASTDMFRQSNLLGAPTPSTFVGPRTDVAGLPRFVPDTSGDTKFYRILDQTIKLCASSQLYLIIDSLLGLLRVDEGVSGSSDLLPKISMNIAADAEGWVIAVDGLVEATCTTESILAELERLVVRTVVPITPHMLTLHAAALQREGRTLLLAGPSGSGKTTLSVALRRAGWKFGSDELVLIERGLSLRPLPLPPCIKSETFDLVENWFPLLRSATLHRRYGKTVKYLPIQPERLEPALGIVVFPSFQKGANNSLEPVDSFEGLQKLLAQCVFVSKEFLHNDVVELRRWHEGLQYFNLTYDSCEAVSDILDSALQDCPLTC